MLLGRERVRGFISEILKYLANMVLINNERVGFFFFFVFFCFFLLLFFCFFFLWFLFLVTVGLGFLFFCFFFVNKDFSTRSLGDKEEAQSIWQQPH